MPEDMTVHRGRVVSSFESGTARYASYNPVNRVTALHAGSLSALLTTLDPVALSAEREIGIAPGEPTGDDAAAQGIPDGLTPAQGRSRTVATAAGAGLRRGPAVELWNPPQRVSDAYDYWLTRQAQDGVGAVPAGWISDARDLYQARGTTG